MSRLSLLAIAIVALVVGAFAERYWSGTTEADHTQAARNTMTQPLTDLDGNRVDLGRWRGKVLLVNFWATWCAPCLQEIPLIQAAREKYREQGFEVIGIAVDQVDAVRGFREKFTIQYPLLIAPDDVTEILEKYGNSVGGLPHSAIVNRKGDVVESHTGIVTAAQLEQLITTHLN